ncbi:MAG: thiamine pyrophosphate-binding protein [Chloroflexi bacterium]|nr:thiamine pyrophosphate-binding protein [Chloroflexota bacterium]
MPNMPGKHALMELLLAHGVKYVFGNPGTTEQQFMDGLQDYPQISYVLALQEGTAVGMADGYARASGKAGVVNLHVAPGLANGTSLLFDACKSGTSLVVTAGEPVKSLLMREPTLAADLVDMARQFTKWSAQVNRAEDIPMAVMRAFKLALQPPTKPVFLSFPMDVLDEEVALEDAPVSTFYPRLRPDVDAVKEAAGLLADARNPGIVCSDGVAKSGAMEELVGVAELLGAKVYGIRPTEVVFPTSHPLYLGNLNPNLIAMRERLEEFDVLLAVGTTVFTQTLPTLKPLVPERTKLIHLHIDPWEIGKNHPVTVGMQADPKVALAELGKTLGEKMSGLARREAKARRMACEEEKRGVNEAFEKRVRASWDKIPISALRLAVELRDALKPGTIIVDEAITSSPALRQAISFEEPGTLYSVASTGGAIGWGMPATLGVKIARPDRPVVGIVGDGSAMYTVQSLWTAAHYNIAVTYVICGNASYDALKINMMDYLEGSERKSKFIGMDLTNPPLDFAKLAHAFGIPGVRVERPEHLQPALKKALAMEGPAVVDVVIQGVAQG